MKQILTKKYQFLQLNNHIAREKRVKIFTNVYSQARGHDSPAPLTASLTVKKNYAFSNSEEENSINQSFSFELVFTKFSVFNQQGVTLVIPKGRESHFFFF